MIRSQSHNNQPYAIYHVPLPLCGRSLTAFNYSPSMPSIMHPYHSAVAVSQHAITRRLLSTITIIRSPSHSKQLFAVYVVYCQPLQLFGRSFLAHNNQPYAVYHLPSQLFGRCLAHNSQPCAVSQQSTVSRLQSTLTINRLQYHNHQLAAVTSLKST